MFGSASFVIGLVFLQSTCGLRFTSLNIDNHPCKPENLKHTTRYKVVPVVLEVSLPMSYTLTPRRKH
jgi:hypothetical protein